MWGLNRSYAFTSAGLNGELHVTVDFLGFSTDLKVENVRLSNNGGTYTANARDINQAIIKAINNDATLGKLLYAHDGAGDALIVESLVDGLQQLANNLILGFNVSTATGSVAAAATGAGAALATNAYASYFAVDGDWGWTPAVAGQTSTNGDMIESAGNVSAGGGASFIAANSFWVSQAFIATAVANPSSNIFALKVQDLKGVETIYHTSGALTSSEMTDVVKYFSAAKDAAGNLLSDRFQVFADSGLDNPVSGLRLVGKADTDNITNLNLHLGEWVNAGGTVGQYTGTDNGSVSYNVVEGGVGNDVITLNVASTADWNDVLVLKGDFGHDKVYGFQNTIDKIDVSALTSAQVNNAQGVMQTRAGIAHVTTATAAQIGTDGALSATELAAVITGQAANYAQGATDVVFVEHLDAAGASTNLYTVAQVANAASAATGTAIDASEVTILGTIQFDTQYTGAQLDDTAATGDFII
jgi:hypothetical protein